MTNPTYPPFYYNLPDLQEPIVPILLVNYDNINNSSNQSICGTIGICKLSASKKCRNISMKNCLECDQSVFGIFIFLVSLLGLAILIGNALILTVYFHLKEKQEERKIDIFKASLAVADLIAGLLIFTVVFPNIAWIINLSLDQITTQLASLQDSPKAIVGSFFYLLGYTASLYHLLLLAIMRLYAIRWPLHYHQLSDQWAYVGIGIVWLLAIVMATVPHWFPSYFNVNCSPVVFFYLPALNNDPSLPSSSSSEVLSAAISFIVLLVVPFVLMTIIMIVTTTLVQITIRSSQKNLHSSNNASKKRFSKREVSAFKTVAIMQFGFTLTLIPVGVVIALLYAGYLQCDNFSNYYLICFYLSRSNSLVNVLVYSAREKKFRSSLKEIFCKNKPIAFTTRSDHPHTLPTNTKNNKSVSKSNNV